MTALSKDVESSKCIARVILLKRGFMLLAGRIRLSHSMLQTAKSEVRGTK
jgi:hypothetical protein